MKRGRVDTDSTYSSDESIDSEPISKRRAKYADKIREIRSFRSLSILTDTREARVPLDISALSQSELQRLNEEYVALKTELYVECPSLITIIQSRIPRTDKRRAVELFHIAAQHEKNSTEYRTTVKELQGLLKTRSSSVDELEETERRLQLRTVWDTATLKDTILALDVSDDIKGKIYTKYQQFIAADPTSTAHGSLKEWLQWAITLPYGKYHDAGGLSTGDPATLLSTVRQQLDDRVYGMDGVKMRVMINLARRISNPSGRNSILALQGMPGIGKTYIAETIASILGLPFKVVSMGGATDVTAVRGGDSIWVSSKPSFFTQAIVDMKCCNGVILVDEIDKPTSQVQNALLHVMDQTTNAAFRDDYLSEITIDLSKVWFICSLNDPSKLEPALRDRLDIVEVDGYNRKAKLEIGKRHLFPAACRSVGLDPANITITDGALALILSYDKSSPESGIRQFAREINGIMSAYNYQRLRGLVPKGTTHTITPDEVAKLRLVG